MCAGAAYGCEMKASRMERTVVASLVVKNALAREGLRRILTDGGYNVAQSIEDIDELADSDSHIIIVDQAIMEHDGVDRISELIGRFDRAKLVVLTESFDFDTMSRIFAAGAYGYVLNDVPYQAFLAKMQLVSMGEKVAPADLIDTLRDLHPADNRDDHSADLARFDLTAREQDILRGLVMGLPNKLISRELGVSEATVKLAVKTIFRKLSVRNRTQAAILAKELGLFADRSPPRTTSRAALILFLASAALVQSMISWPGMI